MLSLTAHTQIPSSNLRVSFLKASLVPALISAWKSKNRDNECRKSLNLSFRLNEERRALQLGINLDRSLRCGCHKGDGDVELEAEIMNFMAKSEKPSMFPTKEELVRAGRFDLVIAIKKRGGWYSLGWDVENVGYDAEATADSDIAEFQRRIESCKQSGSSSFSYEGIVGSSPQNLDSLQLPGSSSLDSCPSQQLAADEDSGIDGILSRLEKKRNSDFSGKLGKNGYEAQSKSKDEGDDTPLGFGGTDLEENSRLMPSYHPKGTLDSPRDNIRHSTEPETWRSWMNRRAGFSLAEFEAAEISLKETPIDTNKESYHDGITVTTKEYAEDLDKDIINYNEIRTRLRRLESELTTSLRSIRSKREDSISEEVNGSSTELQSLSDAVEFQENEVMSAKQRLRSLRAKLAVVEGKMTLAIIEAQKTVKHKKIGDSRKSLQLLRTTSIVWPNSAAEVLLAGSFDGWTTQRRMRRSKSGVFSITLKLYPGRYEIKFIVNGQWKLDPLRPTVNNNGHQNNLFIVT